MSTVSQFIVVLAAISLITMASATAADNWTRHTIDDSSEGADGVRLADINNDGRPDIVTGWEQGGVVRVYPHPAIPDVKQPWPRIEVGQVNDCEDAVFADVDGDGHTDVVSCCEGNTNSVFVHWNPRTPAAGSPPSAEPWPTDAFPQMQNRQPWMFCEPLRSADGTISELAVGSKGGDGEIGILVPPRNNRRDLSQWNWKKLAPAGWIMSIRAVDMNDDGRTDILYSDRRTHTRGIHWLQRPHSASGNWQRRTLGGTDREVMFLDIADINGDGLHDVACAAKDSSLLILLRGDAVARKWTTIEVPYPKQAGSGKGLAIGDIDGDGHSDLVCTCEHAADKSGAFHLSPTDRNLMKPWTFHEISGIVEGIKFDRIELLDVDADGDLDILTCEEKDNLGVFWYENPGGP